MKYSSRSMMYAAGAAYEVKFVPYIREAYFTAPAISYRAAIFLSFQRNEFH